MLLPSKIDDSSMISSVEKKKEITNRETDILNDNREILVNKPNIVKKILLGCID